jgi:bifunctional DNase/RNase
LIELEVKIVGADESHNFVVLLGEKGGKKVLPIRVGYFEAQAIALPLQGETPPRPLTHDLLLKCAEETGTVIDKIVITEITQEGTYIAEIYMTHDQQTKIIDARPSDAIALALRCGAKIYMRPQLIEFTEDMENIFPDCKGEDLN